MRDLRGQRVTVMGLGAFGGGEGVVRFLFTRGARITVTDLKSEADLSGTLSRLSDCSIETLHLGGHQEADFRDTDLVVVNPAVPPTASFLKLARDASVELTSEMNLFIEHNRGQVLAVTGSIGKSTTTALTERMLAAAGLRTWLGGNIGRSLLPVVDEISPDDWVVLELSSFQLADLDRLRFRPDVAVVTNLRPNHLDWHGSLDDYRAAKQTILRWQRDGDAAVLNADDPDVARWPVHGRTTWFGHKADKTSLRSSSQVLISNHVLIARSDEAAFEIDLRSGFSLPGAHHAMNAAAATGAALAVGVSEEPIRRALAEFRGLPHRLQFLGEFGGRRFYDDSKATTPEAAIAALDAFDQRVVLLAGGYDKQVELTEFARRIAERTKAVALIGQTAVTLDRLIGEHPQPVPERRLAASLTDAFRWAIERSSPGDVVLLSPGCASYGWFNNYVERGHAFAALMQSWAKEEAQHRVTEEAQRRH